MPICKKLEIHHRFFFSTYVQQNGFVERKHRHIVKTRLALLAQASLPFTYWADAFDIVVYLINLLSSPKLDNKTLFYNVYHRDLDYHFLKVFRCECFPNLRPYNQCKLNYHSTSCLFLGYSSIHKEYKCLDLKTISFMFPAMSSFMKTHFHIQPIGPLQSLILNLNFNHTLVYQFSIHNLPF